MGERDVSPSLLRVLVAAGDVWGPRSVADVAARLANLRETSHGAGITRAVAQLPVCVQEAAVGMTPDYDDEFYDADLDGASCELCGRDLECGQWGECDRCTGLDRCIDDLCYGAGRCMHRATA